MYSPTCSHPLIFLTSTISGSVQLPMWVLDYWREMRCAVGYGCNWKKSLIGLRGIFQSDSVFKKRFVLSNQSVPIKFMINHKGYFTCFGFLHQEFSSWSLFQFWPSQFTNFIICHCTGFRFWTPTPPLLPGKLTLILFQKFQLMNFMHDCKKKGG